MQRHSSRTAWTLDSQLLKKHFAHLKFAFDEKGELHTEIISNGPQMFIIWKSKSPSELCEVTYYELLAAIHKGQ